MGAPWFKLYAQDYLGDPKVRMLSDADRGVLIDCWAIQTAIGGVPTDPEHLGRLLSRRPDHALRAFQKVSCFFVDDPLKPGLKVSLRLACEQAQYERKLLANQQNGRSGGRPKKNPLGFHENDPEVNPNARELRTQNSEEDKLPPTPRKRRVAKSESFSEYSDGTKEVMRHVLATCPKTDNAGRTIRVDAAKTAYRLDGLLRLEKVTPEILIGSWTEYLATDPAMLKAPQYFYGKEQDQGDGANWRFYGLLIYHRMAKGA